MPTRKEVLAERTYKEEGLEVEKRVFYTLTGKPDAPDSQKLNTHRNSKAIAMLFKTLLETGTLTEDQLDEILLEITW